MPGSLLSNIMYGGLLKLQLTRAVTSVVLADDIALLIVAKHVVQFQHLLNIHNRGSLDYQEKVPRSDYIGGHTFEFKPMPWSHVRCAS